MACVRRESNKPHFILVPFLATTHIIPMVDMGRMLAERGARVSLITTPGNADRIQPIIERAKEANLSIEFVLLSFPNEKFGLPTGWETVENIFDPSLYRAFIDALYSLHEPLEAFLKSLKQPPNCIIADIINAWTAPVARKLGIPRVIFHAPSCISVLTDYNIMHHKLYDTVTDENEYFTVPDFPIKLEVTKAQQPGIFNNPLFGDIRKKILEEESTADGVVISTFLELEELFVHNYEKVIGNKVWTIGPMCLYNKDFEMEACRGNKEGIDHSHGVLTWLNGRDTASVLYINFGTIAYTNPEQLMEIGSGLEASNKPFVWVIKKVEKPGIEKWLSEGFEERTKGRGLIIFGWAPQMVILSHPAVGGFIMHCGWNGVLEAVSMGVPMITWPRFAEHFVNEKLVVDVLRIGVSLGVEVPNIANQEGVMVKSDDISKAVSALMNGGIEADERRRRSKDLSEKAKKAMEEGGSSYVNVTDIIQYFAETEAKKK